MMGNIEIVKSQRSIIMIYCNIYAYILCQEEGCTVKYNLGPREFLRAQNADLKNFSTIQSAPKCQHNIISAKCSAQYVQRTMFNNMFGRKASGQNINAQQVEVPVCTSFKNSKKMSKCTKAQMLTCTKYKKKLLNCSKCKN